MEEYIYKTKSVHDEYYKVFIQIERLEKLLESGKYINAEDRETLIEALEIIRYMEKR